MTGPTTITELAVKIEKIARLAFDPAAAEGEAVNAASMLVQIARKNQIGLDGFKTLLGVTTGSYKLNGSYPPGVMPFGRYKGTCIEQIYEDNPSYLDWVLENVKGNKNLKKHITDFLKTKLN